MAKEQEEKKFQRILFEAERAYQEFLKKLDALSKERVQLYQNAVARIDKKRIILWMEKMKGKN
jgi:hypothetical protein